MAQQQGEGVGIVDMIIDGNRKQRKFFFEKIVQAFAGDLQGKKLALWGLAFKPDTDDIREAPALEIIEWLTEA